MKISLNGNDWTVAGWARHQWKYSFLMETGAISLPQVMPIQATVPGAVQADLRRAGMLPDWNMDLNFRCLDWVEHREWVYEKHFTAPSAAEGRSYKLLFEGLDFSGLVFLNGVQVAAFESMHLPLWVDVTDTLRPGEENKLRVVFLQPPEVDGQIGYTSRTNVLKSRYNYGWDWMPRMVNIGIFRDVWLYCVDGAILDDVYPRTVLEGDSGRIEIAAGISGSCSMKAVLQCKVSQEGELLSEALKQVELQKDTRKKLRLNLTVPSPKIWGVNGQSDQPLYTVETRLVNEAGEVLDEKIKRVGFRTMSYERTEGAPKESLPYVIRVNGRKVPIRGVNWVPLSPFYGTVTEQEYRYMLGQLRLMNINLLRVWGGALLESETFYDICDEMGFLIWQEFPQSSSGIDNTPCEDETFVKQLARAAEEYVVQRRHHACLAVWSAGNELYHADYRPVNFEVRNVRQLAKVVRDLDEDRLYLPASPSGPRIDWSENHGAPFIGDAHGPWNYGGVVGHYRQFNRDDSQLHSEVGAPACPREETLRKYCSTSVWPPTIENPYWLARGAWWIYDKELTELFGTFDGEKRGLTAYVKAFRYIQMEALRYIAALVRRAGDKKAGLIIWMGNEPYPNSANTSVLEYDGCPKPAFYALRRVFSPVMLALSYDSVIMEKGRIRANLFGCADQEMEICDIKAASYDKNGRLLGEQTWEPTVLQKTTEFGCVDLPASDTVTLVRVTGRTNEELCEEYIFTAAKNAPLGALLDKPQAKLRLERIAEDQFELVNDGESTAFCIDVIAKDAAGQPLVVKNNYRSLLPKESVILSTQKPCVEITYESM